MADSSDKELSAMRREALKRMQDMQRRAMPLSGGDAAKQPAPRQQETAGGLLSAGLTGKLPIDEEKAMIAMLIYILYKQGADIKLLLALGYLLM